MGRRNMLDHRMGYVHPRNRTPSVAVVVVGIGTAFAVFLGQAGLVPILEVGAVAAAVGWMAACASYFCMKPSLAERAATVFGMLMTALMVLVKIVPIVPGHFTKYEWMAVGVWAVIGAAMRMSGSRYEKISPEIESAELPNADSGL
jgi:amino acid transporter